MSTLTIVKRNTLSLAMKKIEKLFKRPFSRNLTLRGANIMKQETIDRVRRFTRDRDWDKYHTPSNLAKTIVIEATELLECFQWNDEQFDLEHVKEELADVIVNCQNLLDKLCLDADEIVQKKMEQNEKKYPIEKFKSIDKKYNE